VRAGADQPPSSLFCDANAGLPAEPDVIELFAATERACPANPASAHAPGRRARAVLEEARRRIAAALAVDGGDVLFTSGGTEAANLAVLGLGNQNLPVLLGPLEHPAVLEPALVRGVEWLPVEPPGVVRLVPPARAPGLLCLVHAQSELGTVQPVAAAAALARSAGVPLFVDAAQTLGRVPLEEVVRLADAFALSPHKCGGLRGHGVLVVRDLAARLRPLLRGGAQEHGLRPGTQSPALAAANALAIERAVAEQERRAAAMLGLRDAFLAGLGRSQVEHEVLTPLQASLPNTAMVRFLHRDGRSLLPALDLAGIHASHGAACSSGAPRPPRVLREIGLDEEQARACVRFSFGWRERLDEIARAGETAGEIVRVRMKKI